MKTFVLTAFVALAVFLFLTALFFSDDEVLKTLDRDPSLATFYRAGGKPPREPGHRCEGLGPSTAPAGPLSKPRASITWKHLYERMVAIVGQLSGGAAS